MKEAFFKSLKILFITIFIFIFVGCGNETSSSNKIGYLIDAPIAGVNYECGDIKDVTDINGAFKCTQMPVTFKLGGMTIGVLSEFTADGNIYPQDILDIERNNYDNEKLIKLARFLQSLDDDGDISTHINISQNISQNYQSNHNFDSLTLENLVLMSNKKLVSKENAISHLKANINKTINNNSSTSGINNNLTTNTTSPSTNVNGSCSVNYKIRNNWSTGATVDVTVTNNLASLNNWEISFNFANGQNISNLWNGIYTKTGANVTVNNKNYNGVVNEGGKIQFGFNLNHHGTNEIPTEIRLNNISCSVENITRSSSNTSKNTSTPSNNSLFTQFNVGIGGAAAFPFASNTENETIWVNSVDLMLDSNIANNNYYKNIKNFDNQKFASLQQYLKNSKFLVLWVTDGWQESWFDTAKIQSAMDKGVIPVFNYWYFGDELMNGLNETKKAKYKEDYARLSTFLNKLNGTKIVIMEPEFNKQNITATAQSQHEFASVIGEAIDNIKANTTDVLFSLAMMDTGNRDLNQSSAECGYANCALGDKYEWGLSEIVYNDLINKLDFISFQQMIAQFSRNPQNPGNWDTPNPISYSDSQIGIDVLPDRINNMAKFLKEKYNKPIFLPYMAIGTASWSDTDGDNQIDSTEVIKDGWESKANSVYQKLSTMKETLLANGLFGFAPMELFDNPRHDYGGYQYFMNNEYHLGIISSSAIDAQDIASYGDLKFKSNILDYIYLAPETQTSKACSVHYNIRNSWNNGATIDVTVTNKMANLNGWQVNFDFLNGQNISNLWNGIYSQTGASVKVNNKDYNSMINQGGSVDFGFNLSHNGTNTIPTEIKLNGNICEKL